MGTVLSIHPKDKFLSNFISQEIPADNSYLTKVNNEAKSALLLLNLPTTRDEYWKYTRITPITTRNYTQSPSFALKKTDLEPFLFKGIENRLVFINGFFSMELSVISKNEGIVIEPLAKARKSYPELIEKYFARLADHQNQFFTALNTVYHANGSFILVKENTAIEKPIHIISITDAESAAFNPRNVFILGKNSSAAIICSSHTHSGSSFTNAVTEIALHENAQLSLYFLQNENNASTQINTTHISQDNNSTANIFTITCSGGLIRNNLNIVVDGSGCETHLNGLYLIKGTQHVDNHTLVDHCKPHSHSNELYKGIMSDKSTGVFNGKVFVRQDAQKTNAYQSNQNILLSDDANIYSKPELEIYADDVKCSHGSATGQLDDEAVFYLRARGIGQEQAVQMLLHAFAGEVVEKIKIDAVKEKVQKIVDTN